MGKHKVKRPAIFIDRDGTIISHVDALTKHAQVSIIPGTPKGLQTLHELGFLLIVVTNQPVVSRGMITVRGVERLHKKLNNRLRKQGGWIDAFYFCPHEHKDACLCRKPGTLLIKQAVKKYNIDLKKSFFVGDSNRDVETGRRARVKTILVKTGNGGKDTEFYNPKPDFVAKNFLAAATLIKKIVTKKK